MQKITIDIAAIARINFGCVGCTTCHGCCCSAFEVCVTEAEMERIVGVMPEVNALRERVGQDTSDGNDFEETDSGLLALETDDDGLCIFAYRADGFIRCALHSVALELGVPPVDVKPLACTLWPLAISGGRRKILTADACAPEFHCVSTPTSNAPRLCIAAQETLTEVLGTEAMRTINEAADAGLDRVTVVIAHSLS